MYVEAAAEEIMCMETNMFGNVGLVPCIVEMATEFLNAVRFRPWFFLCCRVRPSVSVFCRLASSYVRHTDQWNS